jgi:hypothetical protein
MLKKILKRNLTKSTLKVLGKLGAVFVTVGKPQ